MTGNKSYCWSVPRPPGHLKAGLIIKNAAISYPNKEFIDANTDTHYTYKQVDERSNRIANSLLSRYKPGDFMAAIDRWSIHAMETYFGTTKAGMVYIPISYRLVPNEVETILRYAGAKAIIFDKSFKPLVDQIDLKIDRYIIGEPTGDLIGYDELLKSEPGEPDVEIRDDTPCLLGFTSGTTGTPKAYLRTHYENFINHMCLLASFDLTYQDVALTAIPTNTGLSWDCAAALARGTVINFDFDPVTALEAIEKYKVTIMWGVPAMFSWMMAVPDFNKYDLSSLRAVGSVGAVLPQSILEGIWEKITPNVYEVFGLQETGFVAVSKPDMKRANPNFVGPPACLHEVKIVDEQDRDKAVGEIGEIIVRFPDGVGEYWRSEDKTKEAFRNGWFHTEDLGKLDRNGYLAISGRVKDMIVSGGYNVFATDVEEQILRYPKVADCAVVGLPDEKWGEKVTAVVKLNPGETCTEEEIISYCKEGMAHYKAPKSVFFDDVPRSSAGKVLKFKLVGKYKEK